MIKVNYNNKSSALVLKAAYEGIVFPNWVGKKQGKITTNLAQNEAYIFFDEKHQSLDEIKSYFKSLPESVNYSYQVDVASFVHPQVGNYNEVLKAIYCSLAFGSAKLFKKTNQKEEKNKTEVSLYLDRNDKEIKQEVKKLEILTKAINDTRNLQIMPENFLNSEQLASAIASDFSSIPNLDVKVLTKKEIEQLNMGLLLSVNKGSTHEPRVVIVTYNGNKMHKKDHIAIVGKGITFDTGGVNTKGYHMEGMKYDMSGSVIAAYVVKALAQMKAKVNASAIMCITDNRINADASLPENVYQSMSGKWVEVVDTDAEGRLVLADGIFYAAEKLKPSTIIDVATLTGSIIVALGNTYSGIWSTNDDKFKVFAQAAQNAQEKVWRMPLHEDYNKGNKGSKVADLASWSSRVRVDSSQAAMFLKEFTKDIDFIHCDVAGTADVAGEPQGVLVATLVEYALLNQK
ncbi:M17 family metallopeptidase [Mycoplasmopsis verecunda]|uniref:Probable cytosol aminopeptidase n=1 Tax=Mycoplasmopsis verecunda TaxID=171291 RepID=A0A1T4M947_9BACT|nr:peptidase M17 [Mycoplasmopsis verecunda]WPB54369.1 leucyl aminopeptidase family protein [Mycoplasmopsis verecunda]SJZ63224.1 leucyl aminopeptidase [Mycoplasmopsis verecunda]